MKNIIILALIIALIITFVGGISGIVLLLYQNNIKDKKISSLNSSLVQSNLELAQANARLSQTTSDLALSGKNNLALQSSLDGMTQNYKTELLKISRITCSSSIPADEIKTISTDSSLGDLITTAVESEYGKKIINTDVLVLWKNIGTAIFVLHNTKNGLDYAASTAVVVATWDLSTGRLDGVYDVGLGCFYYLP
jgi:hypothetical protein